ncbi:MAG: SAF domain-containing protein [Ornithinibacter sp.]
MLAEANLRVDHVPRGAVQPGALTSVADAVHRRVGAALARGESVTASRLVPRGRRSRAGGRGDGAGGRPSRAEQRGIPGRCAAARGRAVAQRRRGRRGAGRPWLARGPGDGERRRGSRLRSPETARNKLRRQAQQDGRPVPAVVASPRLAPPGQGGPRHQNCSPPPPEKEHP